MDDGATALHDRPRRPSPEGAPRYVLRRSVERHHRRRRASALIVLAALALVIGAAVGAPGGTAHHVPIARTGFFAQIRTLAGSGPGSLAASQLAAEDAAINRTLAYTPYVRVAGRQHREIALTFDDGPGPYTPQILSILEKADVPATFFEVGVLEQYFHASTSKMIADGYPIGDHTQTHAPMSKLSAAQQETQLLEQTSLIGNYGAPFPRLFRPPYGLWSNTTLALLHKYRMLMVMWTVDTSDYRRPGTSTIVDAAVNGARPGAIILMHDAGGDRAETVAALPHIIAWLHARGYKLVTVPRLLLDNPAPANQQISSITGSGG
jgi:peptidoglycan-N-acetylglucosamine deacetylase